MNFRTLFLGLSALMLMIALIMLAPLAVAMLYGEWFLLRSFAVPIALSLVVFGATLAFLTSFWGRLPGGKKVDRSLVPGDALLLVSFSWFFVAALSALPFYLSGAIPSFVDAFFESISGYTTTGASILSDIEAMPRALLFWRAMTHWIGGMGFIVLTIALFPLLGISGAQLMRAESPGPDLDKVTYRINDTAKILWLIYTALTAVEVLLLYLGGMGWFDAVVHSFATMSTGGYSSRNASIGAFPSPYIQWVIIAFMIIAGSNFIIFFYIVSRKFDKIRSNTELKVYLAVLFVCSLIVTLILGWQSKLPSLQSNSFADNLRLAAFQVASILTSTGFTSTDYELWPEGAKALLLVMMFSGGCAGSTSGGIKIIRVVCLVKKSVLELRYMLNPRGFFRIFVNGQNMGSLVIASIIGFLILYLAMLLLSTIVLALFGSDLITAFSGSLAVLGNIGPGFGALGATMNYSALHPFAKAFLSVIMVIGRLELYTVLVLLMPRFWRRF